MQMRRPSPAKETAQKKTAAPLGTAVFFPDRYERYT
jgi:hypothetical protein